MKTSEKSEFAKFDDLVRKIFSVPHEEIVKREKAYKQKRKRAKQKRTNRRTTEGKPYDGK